MLFKKIYVERTNINNKVDITEYESLLNGKVLYSLKYTDIVNGETVFEVMDDYKIKDTNSYHNFKKMLEVTIYPYDNLEFIDYVTNSKNIYYLDKESNKIRKVINIFKELNNCNYKFVVELKNGNIIKLKEKDRLVLELKEENKF